VPHGREAIHDGGRRLVDAPLWRVIRRICGSMRFIADGGDEAEGFTMMTVFQAAGDEATTTLPWSSGEDHDRFVRTGRGWRFVRRRWIEHFARGDVVNVG
jgi:hypothetical protein